MIQIINSSIIHQSYSTQESEHWVQSTDPAEDPRQCCEFEDVNFCHLMDLEDHGVVLSCAGGVRGVSEVHVGCLKLLKS